MLQAIKDYTVMKDTIIFNATDAEEEITVSAEELKNYVTEDLIQENENQDTAIEEINQKDTEQDEQIEGIKTRLEALEQTTEDQAEAFDTEKQNTQEAIEGINTSLQGITESLNATNQSVSEEISARQSAVANVENELKELIKSEIEKEQTSRTTFESVLSSQIEQEYSDRVQADKELEEKLYQELTSTFANVDFASADRIVKSDLTAHIESVQTSLTTEVKELESQLEDLHTSLNEEITNRIKGDNALQGVSGGSGASNDYSLNYELMTIDALEQGEVLDDSIFLQSTNSTDSYVTASQIKKWMACASQKDFEKEVKERREEDAKLDARLITETTSRKDEDSVLQKQIDGLDTRTTEAEGVLKTLTGSGEGSIKKSIADKIAEVVSDAPEAFDTLKEIADWVSSHEGDALSMQNAITENATAIEKETQERQLDILTVTTSLGEETEARIKDDQTLQENIDTLTSALETEKEERETGDEEMFNTLKEAFEAQVADITNNKIGEVVDDKLAEITVEVSKNTQNISILDDKVAENKSDIDTLNDTVFAEKIEKRLLVSTTSGTPKWDTLSSLIKSINVNSSSIDERGNVYINIPTTAKLVTFSNASNSIDGFLTPFRSTNGRWYIHVANWWGGIYGNGTIRGTVYYVE